MLRQCNYTKGQGRSLYAPLTSRSSADRALRGDPAHMVMAEKTQSGVCL